MTAAERTKQREQFDDASEAYERELALFNEESRKWAEVWRRAGKEAPPTQRIKPVPPPQPTWGDCEHCNGCGLSDKDPLPYFFPCSVCGGTGDKKARRA